MKSKSVNVKSIWAIDGVEDNGSVIASWSN